MCNKQEQSYKLMNPINFIAEEAKKPPVLNTRISDAILKGEKTFVSRWKLNKETHRDTKM